MVDYIPMLAKGTLETLYMTVMSTLFSYLFGLPLGVWVYITQKGNLRPNRGLNTVLSWIVNIGRSIPFIILIVALIPFTRLIVGTAIGPTAAIVPLIVAAIPFVARPRPWGPPTCKSFCTCAFRKPFRPLSAGFPSRPSRLWDIRPWRGPSAGEDWGISPSATAISGIRATSCG